MLGNLFTMLCVSDVDGRLLRANCICRVGVSIVPLCDEFKLDDVDVEDVELPDGREANADNFVRLLSNESLLYRDDENDATENE